MEKEYDKKNCLSSEWGSDIVLRSTPKKRKRKSLTAINPNEKEIIEKFEEGLEKSLSEKAAKTNLSKVAVKSILKYVVTDENVLALMKRKENDEDISEIIPFEPKITRSKAKELSTENSLLQTLDQAILNESKVHTLLSSDLQEESSDDEYVPAEEESEDDSSFCCTVSNPPTPSTSKQCQLDDEIFKVPETKSFTNENFYEDNPNKEEPNIALRTRSKLSLNQTPLEKIEQSFVPPDITNDMYEFDCNDDDWKNFLNSFTQPLDEVAKNNEEEDFDPEYNILSDEEITKVDTEELRDDRAVRVPKRELNDLIAELFEYVNIYENRKDFQSDNLDINLDSNSYPIQQFELDRYIEIFDGASNKQLQLDLDENIPISSNNEQITKIASTDHQEENCLSNLLSGMQQKLLEQQMCQHVQMLVQNFMLTYNHPFFSEYAYELKEYLLNFKLLADKEYSVFKTVNLEGGLELVEKWQRKFLEVETEALETVNHFTFVMEKSIDCFNNKMHYFLPIPDTILKTISESEVFMYPQLLPKIPFKHPDLQNHQYHPFSLSEYQLVALGLEEYINFLMNDKEFMKRKRINMLKISEVIHKMLMPSRKTNQIYRIIYTAKKWKDPQNPIVFYFKKRRAPFTVHRVIDLNLFNILPPKQRPASLLPRQWRKFIYKTYTDEEKHFLADATILVLPPKKLELKEPTYYRKILPKSKIPEVVYKKKSYANNQVKRSTAINRFRKCLGKPISFVKYVYLVKNLSFLTKYFPNQNFNSDIYKDGYKLDIGMLPSMPCVDLLALLQKNNQEECGQTSSVKEVDSQESEKEHSSITEKTKNMNKEHIDDISIILNGSPNIKNARKEQSILDKKKAKKRREFLASLAMLAPPVPEVEKAKREQFSKEYIKKLKETLTETEFENILDIFLNQANKDAVDFYRKLKSILVPKYKDLADEFLLFLTIEQAHAVGELIPFLIMHHMMKFLRYIELYFKDQPSQLRKVYKNLQDLNDTPDVNLEKIKSTILPLLKSNPLLCDSFLQLFLEESPTATILNGGAWDVIDVNKELNRAKEEGVFEIIAVTDEDPPCKCGCHKKDKDQPQKHHCNDCGLKFIQGKVYCQTSKGMKPVNVTFPLDPDIDHNARLSVPNKIKKVDSSTNKSSSSQDNKEENQTYIENDVDGRKRKVRVCRSNKKSPTKQKKKDKSTEKENANKLSCKSPTRRKVGSQKISILQKPEESSSFIETDWKNLPSPEYINVPLSDSDSSQEDDRTLTDTSKESNENITSAEKTDQEKDESQKNEDNVDSNKTNAWTREEDRVILETYKQNFNRDPINLIKQRLPNRTDQEIRLRFDNLMNLLQEMYLRGDSKISFSS